MRKWPILVFILVVSGFSVESLALDAMDTPVPAEDSWLDFARAAEKSGDFMHAAEFYEQVLSQQPDNADVKFALAESYRRSGKSKEALPLYDALLAKHILVDDAKEAKALAWLSQGDFDAAALLLGEVVAVDATRWKTLNALGVLFAVKKLYPEAQKYFTAALKLSPSNTSVMNNQGLVYAMAKRLDQAVDTLSAAATLEEVGSASRKQIDLNLALVYGASGRLEDAQLIAAQYYSGKDLNNNMGIYAHLAKDDRLAASYFNMALTESKTLYSKAWNNLAAIGGTKKPGVFVPEQLAPAAGKSFRKSKKS